MTEPSNAEIAPDAQPRGNGVILSLPIALTVLGASILVFAPGQGRLFGVPFVALALVTPARSRAESLLDHIAVAVRNFGGRHENGAGYALRSFGAVAGILMAAAAWQFRDRWPVVDISIFLGTCGALLLACVAVDAWPRPKAVIQSFNWISLLAIVVSIAALAVFVYKFSANFPFFDEYISTLPFVATLQSWDWPTLTEQLTQAHFAHRIVSTRLLAMADFYAMGQINFVHLAWMSFAFLVACGVLIHRSVPEPVRRPLLFAPFVLLLLQPQYHQLTLWAFSIQHFSSPFFSVAAFAWLAAGPRRLFPAILAFAAASYSFATGVFVGLVGVAYLWDQKRHRDLVYWSVPFALLVVSYFQNLTVGPTAQQIVVFGIRPPTLIGKLKYFTEFIGSGVTLGYFSDFVGGKASEVRMYSEAAWLARIAGIGTLFAFAYLLARAYWRRNLVLFGLIAITLLAAAMAANGRSSTPATSAFLSRYTINSVLIFGLLYLAFADLHLRFFTRAAPFSLAGAALFCVLSYRVTLPYAVDHAANLRYTMLQSSNAITQGATTHLPHGPLYSFNALRGAVEKGVYTIPEVETLRGLTAPPETVDGNSLAERELPWKILDVGENSVAYTFMLGPTAENADPSGHDIKVLLANREGVAHAFRTFALADLPGHDKELFGASPEGTTRVVCVEKSALPAGQFGVFLYEPNAVAPGVAKTGLAIPTIWDAPAALGSLGLPTLLHRQAHCLRTVDDPDGHCWVTTTFSPEMVKLPPEYSVEVLVRPTGLPGPKLNVVWELADPDAPVPTGLRLLLDGTSFVVEHRERKEAKSVSFPAQIGAWHWIAVGVRNGTASVFSVTVTPDTGQLGSVSTLPATAPKFRGEAKLTLAPPPSSSGDARLEVNELRISSESLNSSTITDHWPVIQPQ